ncbi:MAG: hypothetical protein NWR37_09135 [Algoriphagus sp.]|uniref:hypothetical protein n=2 Tax=Algoriphagus sp. TaxID=1872435 RepID=UPI002772BAA8|nr:hypothetical protein [Algoriphagus sp.]
MLNNSSRQLFLLGLTLMLLFGLVKRLTFLPNELGGFDTLKSLKILIGLGFILGTLLIYRKPKSKAL